MSDTMLHGVLNMPPECWSNSPLDTAQRHGRYVEASCRIQDLERELAEVTKKRDEWKELYERLNESLASNKRLFSNKLAEKVIDDQVKRIKFLEDILSKTEKELLNLKGQ